MSDVFAAEAPTIAGQKKNYGGILSQRVEGVLSDGNFTADEIAKILGESVLSVRPRVSELVKDGTVVPTGERRANDSGIRAKVFALASKAIGFGGSV